MYSRPQRPRPGRWRQPLALRTRAIVTFLVIIITLLIPTLAQDRVPYQEYNSPAFRRLAARGAIDIDRRDPPLRPAIRRRQDDREASGSTESPSSTPSSESRTSAASSSAEESGTAAASSSAGERVVVTSTDSTAEGMSTSGPTGDLETASASTPSSTALPSPFDTSLGSNFTTQSCPDFFNAFLSNATFQECLPTSLLLQNSNSFFQASRSDKSLSNSLDASCAASLAQCSPLMASLASELVQDSNCGQEYRAGNPIVDQALGGLAAYEPLYRATCLKSKRTGNYCFVDDFGNSTNLSDSYTYYLALGTELPAASRPTCDQCLMDVMGIFAGYAANKKQPISTTYINAAQQMNLGCGPGFINATIPAASVSGATPSVRHSIPPAAACFPFVAAFLLVSIAF